MDRPLRRALAAGAIYFAVVFAAGFALGVLRTLALEPALGAVGAVAAELPVILAVSWLACRWTVGRLRVPPAAPARLAMGGFASALLMAAEAAVSVLLIGRGLGEHLATYANLPAQLGLAAQIAYAVFPLVQARRESA